MRWSTSQLRNRLKKFVATCFVAGASLLSTGSESAAADDVVLPSVVDCDNCFDGGIGGWNLYWHDPHECNSPCHCFLGNWTCPTAAAPRVFASVEFVPLIRDQLSPAIFAARASATSSTTTITTTGVAPNQTTIKTDTLNYSKFAVLTEDDFSSDFDPGMRLSLGVALNDQLRLEGAYIGNYSWNGFIDAQFPGSGASTNAVTGTLLSPFSAFGNPFGNPTLGTFTTSTITRTEPGPVTTTQTTGIPLAPIPGIDYVSSVQASYASQLSMTEANLRHRLSNISTSRVAAEASVLIGIRQMTLSEALAYAANSAWPDIQDSGGVVIVPAGTSTNTVNVATSNRLFGPQIGAQTQFLVGPRTWIDFEAKGAILFGTANSTFDAAFQNVPALGIVNGTANYTNSANMTTFLGDLALRYNYQVTPSLTFNAGYNAFFLGGVALASKNLNQDVQTLLGGAAQPDHTGRVVYHGPSLGFVFAR